jgi:hypothetical protein
MQKLFASKCGQEKIKIDLFRDFLQKLPISKLLILFQLKFPLCITLDVYGLTADEGTSYVNENKSRHQATYTHYLNAHYLWHKMSKNEIP